MNEAAVISYSTQHKTSRLMTGVRKPSNKVRQHDSDEALKLRIKFLEENNKLLKRDQLNKRIKGLEEDVDVMSMTEEKHEKKSKRSRGESTLTNLRYNDKLNKDVNDEMKTLRFNFDTNLSGKSEGAKTSQDKNVKLKVKKLQVNKSHCSN